MRVLITGGNGFIGRTLVPQLLNRGDLEVTLLLLEEFGGGQPLPQPLAALRPRFDAVYADLRNFRLTARAIRDAAPEAVIHLAAVGVSDPFLNPHTALRHNVAGTLHLLAACFESGQSVRKLIVARTPGELTAMNVYAASKAAAWNFCEMYARTAGWPILGAMIFQAYGPHQPPHTLLPSALRAALAGEDFPMTTGAQEKDWIEVSDVAAGFAALLDAQLPPGETLEFGAGQAVSVIDVVRRLYALVGRGGEPRPGILPNRPGENQRQTADAARTGALIGWRSVVSLDEGLRRLINHAAKDTADPYSLIR